MQHLYRHSLLPLFFPRSFSCKFHSLHVSLGMDGCPTANGNSIHFPAFYYDPLISLPCGNLIFYLRMGHIEARFMVLSQFLPACACRRTSAPTHTPSRAPLYVLSVSLCPFRVRPLAITGFFFDGCLCIHARYALLARLWI